MRYPLLALLLAAIGAPAAADIAPSPLGDIYETFNDCLAVAQPTGLNVEKAKSLGWSKATMSTKDGKSVDGPLIYGNPKRKPIMLLTAEKGEGLCIVMARLESAEAFPKFLEAWQPHLPKPDKDGTISFSDDGHIVQIRRTGTADRPALTMAVMTPLEKK